MRELHWRLSSRKSLLVRGSSLLLLTPRASRLNRGCTCESRERFFFRGSVITRRNDASPKRLREDFEVVEVGWVNSGPIYQSPTSVRRQTMAAHTTGSQQSPRRKTGAAATPRLITRVRSFAPVPGHSQAKMVHDVPLLAKYCRSTEPRTPSARNLDLWWPTPQRQTRPPPLPLFLSSESSRDETKSRPGHLKTWYNTAVPRGMCYLP